LGYDSMVTSKQTTCT